MGANIKGNGHEDWNCLLAACEGGKDETVLFLAQQYPEMLSTKDENGETALTLAEKYCKKSTSLELKTIINNQDE